MAANVRLSPTVRTFALPTLIQSIVVVLAIILVLGIITTSANAKEVLPPIAYFNRTMHPPLVLYKGYGEHLRIVEKIQRLEHRYNYELLTAKNTQKASQISDEINRWKSLRDADYDNANKQVEKEDGPLPQRPLLSLGIVSDIQYAPKEEEKRRHFKLSKLKLQHAVNEIRANRSHLDVMMNLGDTVDDTMLKVLPEVLPVFEQLSNPTAQTSIQSRVDVYCGDDGVVRSGKVGVDTSLSSSTIGASSTHPIPVYHMLGNHDFLGTLSKDFDSLHTLLGMPSRYYALDAVQNGYETAAVNNKGSGGGSGRTVRLIVLDGNDLAIYSTDNGSEKRKQAEAMLGVLKRRRAKNAKMFNGALSNPQIDWLKEELKEACDSNKLVLIFIHHQMRPRNEPTNLWNDVEVVPIIASYGCVLAVVNGHAHKWMYDYQHTLHRDVHFITFGGMVQSPFTSWGFIDVFEDKLRVHGLIFGRPIDEWYDVSDKSAKYGGGRGGMSNTVVAASFGGGEHKDSSSSGGGRDANPTPPRPTVFVSSAPHSGKEPRLKDQQKALSGDQQQQQENEHQIKTLEAAFDKIAADNAIRPTTTRRSGDSSLSSNSARSSGDSSLFSTSNGGDNTAFDSSAGGGFLSSSAFLTNLEGDVLTTAGTVVMVLALIIVCVTINRMMRGGRGKGMVAKLFGRR